MVFLLCKEQKKCNKREKKRNQNIKNRTVFESFHWKILSLKRKDAISLKSKLFFFSPEHVNFDNFFKKKNEMKYFDKVRMEHFMLSYLL